MAFWAAQLGGVQLGSEIRYLNYNYGDPRIWPHEYEAISAMQIHTPHDSWAV